MRLPKAALAATLAARQLPSLLPLEFCNPSCPNCRTDVALFDEATSCMSNSAFLNDCSTCQQCITDYQNKQGSNFHGEIFQVVMVNVLNLCSNSTDPARIQLFKSEASKLSMSRTTPIITPTSPATSIPTLATAASLITPAPLPSGPPTQSSEKGSSNTSRIVEPVIGSVLGLVVILALVYFIRRRQSRGAKVLSVETKEVDDRSDSGESRGVTPQPQPEEPKELETVEVYELPAAEPVGVELHTPREGKMGDEDWPLPMAPLRAMFVKIEMRDERMGDESLKHETFYNP